MNVLDAAMSRLERWSALDSLIEPIRTAARSLLSPTMLRNVLSGVSTGHPIHPVLTDVPIGAWSMASLLDACGGPSAEHAADLLVATGLVAAVPTAAAGLNDWSDTHGPEARVGLIHAALNGTALSLYAGSLAARRAGARTAGRGLAFAGLGILLASGYLGGHLAFAKGVRVNRTAWHEGPTDWQDAGPASELAQDGPSVVDLGGLPILVVHDAGRLVALDNVCTHAGGSLDEGTFKDGCVTCPLHGSMFRLADGSVVRGPASVPEPSYEARVEDGRLQLRARR